MHHNRWTPPFFLTLILTLGSSPAALAKEKSKSVPTPLKYTELDPDTGFHKMTQTNTADVIGLCEKKIREIETLLQPSLNATSGQKRAVKRVTQEYKVYAQDLVKLKERAKKMRQTNPTHVTLQEFHRECQDMTKNLYTHLEKVTNKTPSLLQRTKEKTKKILKRLQRQPKKPVGTNRL